MSVDLWDMSERAESLVRKTNFQGMTKDEVIGLFYQEFCEPTLAEKLKQEENLKNYNLKVKWLLENGFKKEKYKDKEIYVDTDNLTFCKDDIELFSLSEIEAFVKINNL